MPNNTPIIQTKTDLDRVMRRMGTLRKQIKERETERDILIAQANKKAEPYLQKRRQQYEELEASCIQFVLDHRETFTPESGSSKTVKLPYGEINFYICRKRIICVDSEATVIDRLRRAGHDAFIRTKEFLDKTLLQKHPDVVDTIEGLRIEGGHEETQIKPIEA
jgi:phage host-nuclease inhibitor protein Gam